MKIHDGSRVCVLDGVLVRELDGEAVILNLATETYHGLDPVGTRMWQVVTTSPSTAAALEQLGQEYDVDQDVLRRDLEKLLETLVENQLIEIRPAGGS